MKRGLSRWYTQIESIASLSLSQINFEIDLFSTLYLFLSTMFWQGTFCSNDLFQYIRCSIAPWPLLENNFRPMWEENWKKSKNPYNYNSGSLCNNKTYIYIYIRSTTILLWYHRVAKRQRKRPDMSWDYDIRKITGSTWIRKANHW